MFIHRFHLPYYQQVAVFYWPILFFELWRVDRWSAETGRQAFVQVDRYGRAWVPYFEGMARNFAAHDIATRFYAPSDVEDLCPQVFENALTQLSADACESWGPGPSISYFLGGTLLPWTPVSTGVSGSKAHLEPD